MVGVGKAGVVYPEVGFRAGQGRLRLLTLNSQGDCLSVAGGTWRSWVIWGWGWARKQATSLPSGAGQAVKNDTLTWGPCQELVEGVPRPIKDTVSLGLEGTFGTM